MGDVIIYSGSIMLFLPETNKRKIKRNKKNFEKWAKKFDALYDQYIDEEVIE